jgi:hypothetical protein
MSKLQWLAVLGLAVGLVTPGARGQTRPYIGYAYPAGGQQGTTFEIRLGGQGLEDVSGVRVSGDGVTARVTEYFRRLSPQEIQLLSEQTRDLRKAKKGPTDMMAPAMMAETPMMMMDGPAAGKTGSVSGPAATSNLIARLERRIRENVQTPACASIANLALLQVKIAADAPPGERELRLVTPRGISNPLMFHVGQLPEVARKPMLTCSLQILGKEALALRKRPPEEAEVKISVPCTANGQIASGEVNSYRFAARKGQRLVISTQGRQLIPYIADAVPGWFQPVLALQDAQGKEVAFDDDFRFKPDPVIFYEVPKDGEYVFTIRDSIYRGREDFVYRVSIGELPFITGIYPLGGQTGVVAAVKMKGWNLADASLSLPPKSAGPGLLSVSAQGKRLVSNRVPFMLDTLPEIFDLEANETQARAQKVHPPVIINGRVDKDGDWDVYQFTGHAGEQIAVEVDSRRLDSPLDSVIKLTDINGKLLAFSDDRDDMEAGVNTHHADSFFLAKLPAEGQYFVHIGDTARQGGEEYAYRLRISAPQPDFALRVVPSSVSLRGKNTATLTVHLARKDGLTGPIKLSLLDPPAGLSAAPVTLTGTQTVARLTLKSDVVSLREPVRLTLVGSATVRTQEVVRAALPAEDRMQAFLWRHLVPAQDLEVLVFDPTYEPPAKRIPRPRPPVVTNAVVVAVATNSVGGTNAVAAKPKFSKQQIVGRLRQLKLLYEEGLLTDDFYDERVTECETTL